MMETWIDPLGTGVRRHEEYCTYSVFTGREITGSLISAFPLVESASAYRRKHAPCCDTGPVPSEEYFF